MQSTCHLVIDSKALQFEVISGSDDNFSNNMTEMIHGAPLNIKVTFLRTGLNSYCQLNESADAHQLGLTCL